MNSRKKFILLHAAIQAFFACCILSSKDIPNWIVISPIIAGGTFIGLYSCNYDED